VIVVVCIVASSSSQRCSSATRLIFVDLQQRSNFAQNLQQTNITKFAHGLFLKWAWSRSRDQIFKFTTTGSEVGLNVVRSHFHPKSKL